jgi:hypothetical protein
MIVLAGAVLVLLLVAVLQALPGGRWQGREPYRARQV